MSSQIVPLMQELTAEKIDVSWFGAGINACGAGMHVAPDERTREILQRVIYTIDASTQLLPSMMLLSELNGCLNRKVAFVGAWSDKIAGLSEALKSMGGLPEVKIIVLFTKEVLMDYKWMDGWTGAWIAVKPHGYIMACLRSCVLSSADVSSKLKDTLDHKWNMPCPAAMTVQDPYPALFDVNADDKQVIRDVVQNKCSGSDILKEMGYSSEYANVSVLTPQQQLAVCRNTVPFAIGAFLLQVAVALKMHI